MSMAGTEPRGDAKLRGFARQIAKLQRDLRILEVAAQGAYRSVEEGSVDFYDEDGVLRERVGKQKDGSYGRVALEGPVPPIPSEPDVVVIDNGVVAITWDGRSEEKWPIAEFRNVRVHLGDAADFTPTRNNQVGAIFAARGGTIVAVTESDDDNPVYVRLVAVSTAGHTSDPSPAVLVDELDEDDLADEQEELEWEDGDGHTLTAEDIAAGTVTFPLSHDPEVESVVGFWGQLPQEPSEYTIDYDARTATFPVAPFAQVGDRLWLHYAYYTATAGVLVDWESPGWSYLQVTLVDSVDRSAVDFDDSSWATADAALSNSTAAYPVYGWPAPSSAVWSLNTALWMRRTIEATPGEALLVSTRSDNGFASAYWNGVLVSDGSSSTVTIPASSVDATNVLALHYADDAESPGGDRTYADARVEGA